MTSQHVTTLVPVACWGGIWTHPCIWVLLFIQTNPNSWTCWHSHVWLGTGGAVWGQGQPWGLSWGCTCVL